MQELCILVVEFVCSTLSDVMRYITSRCAHKVRLATFLLNYVSLFGSILFNLLVGF